MRFAGARCCWRTPCCVQRHGAARRRLEQREQLKSRRRDMAAATEACGPESVRAPRHAPHGPVAPAASAVSAAGLIRVTCPSSRAVVDAAARAASGLGLLSVVVGGGSGDASGGGCGGGGGAERG